MFRQDRLIAANIVRATFRSWSDRAIAAFMLAAGMVAVRAGLADLRWTTAAWTTLGASATIGLGAGRLIATRLAFHAWDGLLAADALHPSTRWRYVLAWHGSGLALLAALTLLARPSRSVVSLPAYAAGATIAGMTSGFAASKRIGGTTGPGRALRTWSHRPIAGVVASMVFLPTLLPARTLGASALLAIASMGTALLALMLTRVDDAVVRFMTIAGHEPRHVIAHHAGGIATFLVLSASGCWLMLGTIAAGIVAAIGGAMLLLLAVRVLAYQLHGKRFADVLVACVTGMLMLVAYSVPVALPVVALALLWRLQRRARAKTWLLA